jgi:hypothetical protein
LLAALFRPTSAAAAAAAAAAATAALAAFAAGCVAEEQPVEVAAVAEEAAVCFEIFHRFLGFGRGGRSFLFDPR